MKTLKLVMITALVSFALMSFASTELGLSKNLIHLKTAITNPKIEAAIQSQVNGNMLLWCKCGGPHTEQIVVGKSVYYVHATFAEWKIYFRYSISAKTNRPIGPGGINPKEFKDVPPSDYYSESNPFGKKNKKPQPKVKVSDLRKGKL